MENKSARAKVQAFGGFLTAMVIPNIGAFIAWGFITALFIPTGWLLKEGANKRGNSSRLTQSFHFFMFEPIFSPVNALNQPI